ncbi:MAG: zinc ribbon domain-containing protein [Nanoarchaeota archaeon]|nr:zinc ribbon domain-containing protein [Nanoarchaeota archaeon]
MLKKKCPSCAKKVERKFNYCPHCGASFKASQESEDFGMLGRDDSNNKIQEEIKLPFGVEKIMNSLIKQLEKQMGTVDFGNAQGMPKGIKIRVARGPPQIRQLNQGEPPRKSQLTIVSKEENDRRTSLPKVEVESKVKRIADTIIYEINAPGVQNKEDVVVTELASGLEIKAYSRDKCYVKFIPLKVEVIAYHVEKEKVIVELRG